MICMIVFPQNFIKDTFAANQKSGMEDTQETTPSSNRSSLRDSQGWDGKLRLKKNALVANAEIISDLDYSDEDAPPVEQIGADDGRGLSEFLPFPLIYGPNRSS